MIFAGFTASNLEANVYIVGCEETKEAIIIDPGGDVEKIMTVLEKNSLQPKYIILTHGHIDHIGGIAELKAQIQDLKVLIHQDDADCLTDPKKNLSSPLFGTELKLDPADQVLKDKDIISFGNLKARVLHTPGHTLGGICLKIEDRLFTGDTLFAGSIGRTDFPGGSHDILVKSIKEKIFTLPDKTRVFPGHGTGTYVGQEKRTNPFLRD